MKVFYKYITATVLALALFLSGCAINNTSFQNKIPVSAERIKGKEIAFDALRELVRLTGNEDSKQILKMLETKSIMITPTDTGFHDPIFNEQKEMIKMIVLLPKDAEYKYWGDMFVKKTLAFYFPNSNAIVLKQMELYTPNFRAIIIDHEGGHALYFQSHSRDEKPSEMQKAVIERDEYEHSIGLMAQIGGEPYKAFMRDRLKKLKAFLISSSSGRQFPKAEREYIKELDVIFGTAKSPTEQRLRNIFVWIAGIFQYIDENYDVSHTEKENIKAIALRDAYRYASFE